jgi:hypothetical protein
MIKLKELMEASIDPKLVARSKESGKLVYFKTPQAKDTAMKAGTHEDPKAKKSDEPKAAAKPNSMFGGDYAKDRGGDKNASTKKGSNDDVDISDYKTDGEGKVLYKGKKVADYVYSPDTDVFVTKTPNGREYFDTQEDMFKYLQKSKEEPKKSAFGPGGTAGSFGDTTKDDFYNAGETLRQMGWKPDDIAKRIGDNLPYIDDEKDIPQIKDSDDKEDWINLYKKSIAMKKAGYSSSEIADKLRANL